MSADMYPLSKVYDGWDGYQISLVRAIAPLSHEQLLWRPGSDQRSVGEVAEHIGSGRVDWFQRMDAPRGTELAQKVPPVGSIAEYPVALIQWLEETWEMIGATLTAWTVSDLANTYRRVRIGTRHMPYRGNGRSGASSATTFTTAASSVRCWPHKGLMRRIWALSAVT